MSGVAPSGGPGGGGFAVELVEDVLECGADGGLLGSGVGGDGQVESCGGAQPRGCSAVEAEETGRGLVEWYTVVGTVGVAVVVVMVVLPFLVVSGAPVSAGERSIG